MPPGESDWSLAAIFWSYQPGRLLNVPRLAAVRAACLPLVLRLFGIARMPNGHNLELSRAKPYDDLVTPTPDAVVGRPAAESTGFLVDDRVFHRLTFFAIADQGGRAAG